MPMIDLSHDIEDGMITYPGLPAPIIGAHLTREDSRARYAPGTEFQIDRISMIGNTGTYIDSPFHRHPEGADLASLELASVANLNGVVVRVPYERTSAIGAEAFENIDVRGRAVLVHTGWDDHWRTAQYGEGHPHLTAEAGLTLAERGAAIVGIDSLNIDGTGDGSRPVHTCLLAAGIPIVEHLRGLGELPDNGFRFFAVPVKIRGFGSFPVRAFAIVA